MVLQIIAHFEGVTVSLGACFLHCLQYSENISSPSSHRSTYRKRGKTGEPTLGSWSLLLHLPNLFYFFTAKCIPCSMTRQYDFHPGLSNARPLKEGQQLLVFSWLASGFCPLKTQIPASSAKYLQLLLTEQTLQNYLLIPVEKSNKFLFKTRHLSFAFAIYSFLSSCIEET